MSNNRKWNVVPAVKSEPDFNNLLAVLRCEEPSRPTLFEFFLNPPLEKKLFAATESRDPESVSYEVMRTVAFRNAGYDYVTLAVPGFGFPAGEVESKETKSLNDGGVISDRASFDAYAWQDPDDADYDAIEAVKDELPSGMKVVINGPGGVEENVISLVGYENLCFMMVDDPDLVADIFENVGSRLVRYYENVGKLPLVGACISNDDWGFKTQTLLSVVQMEEYLYPSHRLIAAAVHANDKPVILHSCGFYDEIIDAVIDDLKYDGRHSYEDAIKPIEDAYEELQGRIGVMGGIDLDYVCSKTPEEVNARSRAMLERAKGRGGFALGTGNSVPEYVPDENYFAMIRAVTEDRL